ncbi:MAG: efflux RND transporter periplasmic adaptor subunit [Blastocatellia bacterium]
MSRYRSFLVLLVSAALAAAAYWFFPSRLSSLIPKAAALGDEITLAAKTMNFGVDAVGVLRATSTRDFGTPPAFGEYWQFQIVNLAAEGRQVKAGDEILRFDAQRVREDLQRYQTELDQATKELEKTKVQIDLELQELKTRLATAENNHEKLKLKQRDDPITDPPLKVEEDRLATEQARLEVEALKERIEWHKKSSEASIRIISSKKARAENKVNEINKGIERFNVKSDREGVVIHKNKWNGERYQVGENIWTGETVVQIPNLSTIVAEAFVPEVDLAKVKPGQRAEVTIDAFPGKTYSGVVKNIGKLVRPKSWDIPNKILDVEIALDQLDTKLMRPAMSIKAKIETAAIADCLAIPLKAARTTGDGTMVKVKTDQGWQERRVKLGESNGSEVIVTEGLKAGDRVASDFAKAK